MRANLVADGDDQLAGVIFPRSCGEAEGHGTFQDVQRVSPDVAELGFDIVYLPPVHPIGRSPSVVQVQR